QWTWRLLTPLVPESAHPAPLIQPANTASIDVSSLIAANLYGEAAPTSSEEQVIPLSNLSLALTGVFASVNGGVALISADGGPETAFQVGDEIVAGVTLHQVLSNQVLIRRGGITESLMLRDATGELPEGFVTTRAPPPNSRP